MRTGLAIVGAVALIFGMALLVNWLAPDLSTLARHAIMVSWGVLLGAALSLFVTRR